MLESQPRTQTTWPEVRATVGTGSIIASGRPQIRGAVQTVYPLPVLAIRLLLQSRGPNAGTLLPMTDPLDLEARDTAP